MPNIKSAIKKARRDVRRYDANRVCRSRIHTLIRKVLDEVAAKNKPAAQEALKRVQQVCDKAAKRHIIHKNTAARRIARLSRRLRLVA